MPAALRDDQHYLTLLLDRQRSPEGPTVSRPAAAFLSRRWCFRAHRRLGRIRDVAMATPEFIALSSGR
jgi:hypothetical protein